MKMSIILNTPELGGAERSIIEQISLIKEGHQVKWLIPKNRKLKHATKIMQLLNDHGYHNISRFYYPNSIYCISRKNSWRSLLFLPLAFLQLPVIFLSLRKVRKSDIIYANGGKAAVFFLLFSILSFFRGRLIWHFRDYPSKGLLYLLISLLIKLSITFKITLASNSHSVQRVVNRYFQQIKSSHVIYNPTGKISAVPRPRKDEKIIGIASMLTPWKGIHEIIFFSHLMYYELKKRNIKFHIYGEDIYKTNDGNQNYKEQLLKLASKYSNDLLDFRGSESPSNIFSEIDLLIHSSSRPEPFGRTILEAFATNTPVISTALGGAAELAIHNKTALIYQRFDYNNLLRLIDIALFDEAKSSKLVSNAGQFRKEIEESMASNLSKIINSNC